MMETKFELGCLQITIISLCILDTSSFKIKQGLRVLWFQIIASIRKDMSSDRKIWGIA